MPHAVVSYTAFSYQLHVGRSCFHFHLLLMSLPTPPPHTIFSPRIFMNLTTGSGAGWGGGHLPPFVPPPVTTLVILKVEQQR